MARGRSIVSAGATVRWKRSPLRAGVNANCENCATGYAGVRLRRVRLRPVRLRPAASLSPCRRSFDRRGVQQIEQLPALLSGPDIAEPMPDIAAQDERVVGGLALGVFVGNEG